MLSNDEQLANLDSDLLEIPEDMSKYIKLNNHLKNLEENEDYQELFTKYLFKDYLVEEALLLRTENKGRAFNVEQLTAIANLKSLLDFIRSQVEMYEQQVKDKHNAKVLDLEQKKEEEKSNKQDYQGI